MKTTTGSFSRMRGNVITLAAAALLTGGVAVAQTGGMPQGPSASNPGPNGPMNSTMQPGQGNGMNGMNGAADSGSMHDKMFAKKALAGGMAEVQLGQLAQQKASADDVKQFAQKMVDDHTKLNDQMKPIAAQVGVQPPADLPAKDKKLMTKLQGLSGDQFDKEYIKAMLKDHEEDNKEFSMEASMGQNPQEKEAAQQGDVIIKQHLQMVQDLAKTHGVSGGKSSM